jgi:hypothetical protein
LENTVRKNGIAGKVRSLLNVFTGLVLVAAIGIIMPLPVAAAGPVVSAPNGGENWEIGSSQNITWNSMPAITVIDVGSGAADLETNANNADFTTVDMNNPANASGTLNSVEIWANVDMTGVKVVAFNNTSGNVLSPRSAPALIGNVTAGSKQTFTVSLPIQAGDYIGIYAATGNIDGSLLSGAGWWYKAGDYTETADATFTAVGSRLLGIAGFSINNNVDIEVSRDGGSNWTTIVSDTANDGSQSWTVTSPATTQARIKVVSAASEVTFDTSDSNFTIANPPPTGVLHVKSISLSAMSYLGNTYVKARAIVSVVDQDGNPIEGAKVYGTWTEPVKSTRNGLTVANGTVIFYSNMLRYVKGQKYTFTVTNITLAGYTYNAAANQISRNTIKLP